MDMEKTMEFILEQQGEFAVHIGELREQQATSGQQIETLGQAVRDLLQVATLQSERLDAHDRRLEGRENGARLLNSDSINLWNVSTLSYADRVGTEGRQTLAT